MHPFIKEYLNSSQPASQILKKHLDQNNLLEVTYLELYKTIDDNNISDEQLKNIDLSIQIGHEDSNLYFMFIALTCLKFARIGWKERARSLMTICKELAHESMSKPLLTYYYKTTAFCEYNLENQNECYKYYKKFRESLVRDSPQYFNELGFVATFLCVNGKLADLDQEQYNDLFSDKIHPVQRAKNFLMNAIETGNIEEATKKFKDFKQYTKVHESEEIISIEHAIKILKNDYKSDCSEDHPITKTIYCMKLLKEGKPQDAYYAYRDLQINKYKIYNFSVNNNLDIHIELGIKNTDAVIELIKLKEAINSKDYFMCLHKMRLSLLLDRKLEALNYWKELINSCQKYQSFGRLRHELRLVKELDYWDIINLMKCLDSNTYLDPIWGQDLMPTKFVPKVLTGIDRLVGNSLSNKRVKDLVLKYSQIPEIILIRGETGTGKEVVARAIHEESANKNMSFLAINCGALTETLLQSELFGFEAGAFTGAQKKKKGIFEAAGNGTVLLDEFGEISLKLQVSLLRTLESKEVRPIGSSKTTKINCRILVATNANLEELIKEKVFREDLYYRLQRFEIHIKPLRERKEDIVELTEHFLNANNPEKKYSVDLDLEEFLKNQKWKGNVRELKNTLEKVKLHNSLSTKFTVADLDSGQYQQQFTTNSSQNGVQRTSHEGTKEPILDFNDKVSKILSSDNKTEKRRKDLLKLFKQHKNLTRLQIIKIFEISPLTATNDIKSLCDKGEIKKITPSKSPRSHYFTLND